MKTFLTFIFFTVSVTASFTQTNQKSSEHLKFKKIPIDGTLNEYVLKLKKNGFNHIVTEDGVAMLRSDFAGYRNCIIGVKTLKQMDLVSEIVVIFPELDTWSRLSSNYFYLKELLTEKYGDPSETIEKFQSDSMPRDDGDKMYEVQFDRCKFYSIYETELGKIKLSIDHDGVISTFVCLTYSDKINSQKIREKAIDDL